LLVPGDSEPVELLEDVRLECERAPRDIRVLEAEDERAAVPAGVQVVEQGRARGPDVQRAGRAGRDPDARGGHTPEAYQITCVILRTGYALPRPPDATAISVKFAAGAPSSARMRRRGGCARLGCPPIGVKRPPRDQMTRNRRLRCTRRKSGRNDPSQTAEVPISSARGGRATGRPRRAGRARGQPDGGRAPPGPAGRRGP